MALRKISRRSTAQSCKWQKLRALRLDGMAAALSDPANQIAAAEFTFEQRLALLVQREVNWRDSKRLERLLKAARLKIFTVRNALLKSSLFRDYLGNQKSLAKQSQLDFG